MFIGDFNAEPTENVFSDFCEIWFKKLNEGQTRNNATFIDLLLINSPKCF